MDSRKNTNSNIKDINESRKNSNNNKESHKLS